MQLFRICRAAPGKIFACLAVSLLVPVLLLADDVPSKQGSKVHVGVILPLSGAAAGIGQAIQNGFQLGLEKVDPSSRARLVVTFEDDRLAAKESVLAFESLRGRGKVDILINASSGTANALAPLAEKVQVPFIAIAGDPAVSHGRRFVFNLWITPEAESAVLAGEALKRGYKRIARVTALQEGMLAIKKTFDQQIDGRIQVALDQDFPPDSSDFRGYLTKLRNTPQVDALLIALMPGQCGIFAKQARQMGFKGELFGVEMFEDKAEVQASEGALVGQWYVNADDATQDFSALYRSRFPQASVMAAANGYDAALLVGSALSQGYEPSTFDQYLATLKDFKGALGTYSATGDQLFSLPVAVKVVTEQGFRKLYQAD
jgi:branched-chain amino acid transport system substrate-binding protein